MGELGAPSIMEELGVPHFEGQYGNYYYIGCFTTVSVTHDDTTVIARFEMRSIWKIRIKTLAPLESPHSGLSF